MSQIVVKISEEDCNKIEALHYQVEARANLLDRLTTGILKLDNPEEIFNKYMAEYDKYYKEYSQKKFELESKYKPVDKNIVAWQINFREQEMVFEEAESV